MIDAGIPPEHAEIVVGACALAVGALGHLDSRAWSLVELACAIEPERQPAALAAARAQARAMGCTAMLDHVLESCRHLVRASGCLERYPGAGALLQAVECWVAAATMAGRLAPEVSDVLTAPQRALTSLLVTPMPVPAVAVPAVAVPALAAG